MRAVVGPVRALLHLFIDDGRLALAICLWVALAGLVPPLVSLPAPWRAPLLFAGLALVLSRNCLRAIANQAGRSA
jgi:hypothetical protein